MSYQSETGNQTQSKTEGNCKIGDRFSQNGENRERVDSGERVGTLQPWNMLQLENKHGDSKKDGDQQEGRKGGCESEGAIEEWVHICGVCECNRDKVGSCRSSKGHRRHSARTPPAQEPCYLEERNCSRLGS